MSEDKKAEALAFLRNHTAGVLATCGTDGVPHASAVFYVADAKFNLHFITLMNSRKYKALKENPRVAFTVGTQDVPQTIQIEGIAEEILTNREKNMESAKLIDVLMQKSIGSAYENGQGRARTRVDTADVDTVVRLHEQRGNR